VKAKKLKMVKDVVGKVLIPGDLVLRVFESGASGPLIFLGYGSNENTIHLVEADSWAYEKAINAEKVHITYMQSWYRKLIKVEIDQYDYVARQYAYATPDYLREAVATLSNTYNVPKRKERYLKVHENDVPEIDPETEKYLYGN
jgi:hypothetical protein